MVDPAAGRSYGAGVTDFVAAALPVFLAAVVECVEAWTIVVAVGLTRGWRAPLVGVAAAVLVIGVLLALAGAALVDRVDEAVFEVVIGTLLVLFGVRWMRKALLRSIGVIPLRDEDAAFRRQVATLSGTRGPGAGGSGAGAVGTAAGVTSGFDWTGFAVAGQAMLLEGLEMTFLVITLGASGDASYPVAVTAAAAAFVAVGVAGLVARRPLSNVPENTLKTFVSVMLVTFGTYWVASGLGVDWAGGTWALLYLFAAWAVFVRGTVAALRPTAGGDRRRPRGRVPARSAPRDDGWR